jgi:fido (protein-threonine AMPylation protein)
MFREDFVSGGQIRRGDVEYPVRMVGLGEVRERRQRGSAPDRIRWDLDVTCRAFRDHIETVLERGGRVGTMQGALAATKLYARILKIHPYEDGNGRTAFVALQAALLSQGMYGVFFDDLERHDDALGWALRDDARADPNPLAELLIERANAAVREPRTGMLKP